MNLEETGQRSLDWYRARMGNFTGSRVSELMKSGRGGEVFSETAKGYIYQVAAERSFNPAFMADDGIFTDYLNQTNVTTKAMQWGVEQEGAAKRTYMRLRFPDGDGELSEAESCAHPSVAHFAASPDGLVLDRKSGTMRVLEVKCPNLATFMRYRSEIHDGAGLKSVKPEYYWQVMAEMSCTDTESADFIAYAPWLSSPIHVVTIVRDDEAIAKMLERVRLADEMVESLIRE